MLKTWEYIVVLVVFGTLCAVVTGHGAYEAGYDRARRAWDCEKTQPDTVFKITRLDGTVKCILPQTLPKSSTGGRK